MRIDYNSDSFLDEVSNELSKRDGGINLRLKYLFKRLETLKEDKDKLNMLLNSKKMELKHVERMIRFYCKWNGAEWVAQSNSNNKKGDS